MAPSPNRGWLSGKLIRRRKTAGRKAPHFCRLGFERLEERRLLSLSVPAMNSRPGATQTLYLDFDGSAPFAWNNGTGDYTVRGPNSTAEFPASVPAFSTDGDFNNFSTAELATIDHIWQWVAEKFSPFTINVTTVNPGFVSDGLTMTCLIAGSVGDWYGGTAGGVSSIGGFHDGGPNTCFVFSADAVNNGLPGGRLEQYIGESIAHEAGHEVGLLHQRSPGDEYYDGDIFRAPIMGGSSNNTQGRGIWWQTNNFTGQNSSDPVQSDLAALTQGVDQLSYAGDTGGGALSFDGAGKVITASGIINGTSDVDSFTFTATGVHATFTIKNWQYGGMLAPTVKIRISSTQTYVSATIVTANTSASIDTSNLIVSGNYVLEVGSQGNYGDIGQYTVDGSITVFAAYDAATRSVNVGGFAGNNNVTLSASGNTLTVQDSINGGPTSTQTFTLSLVDSVHVNLGSGDDKLNCVGLTKADNSALPVYIFMGGGFDTLNLGGGGTFLTFTVNATVIDVSFAGVRSAQFWNYDAERVEIHGTTSDNDLFNINSLNNYSNVYAYGDQGNDKLVVSPEVMASNTNTVIFYGEGGTDTLELDGSTLGLDQRFTLLGNTVQRFLPTSPFASETQFDSTLEVLSIKGGGGNDDFLLLSLAAGQTLNAIGNGGDDTFHVGKSDNGPFPYPSSANIFGTINVTGGPGNNLLNIDDVASSGFFNGSSITGTSFFNQNTTGRITFDSTLDQLDFHTSNHGSQFVTIFGLPATTKLNLFAGTGIGDTLIVDDHALAVGPFQMDLGVDYYKEYYGTAQSPTVRQFGQTTGFENFRVTAHSSTTAINVMAIPAGVSTQVTAGVNTGAVTVYPHDANGNLTINGYLSVYRGGGGANLIIDDTGQANPIDYVFGNTLGIIDTIDGLGAGTLSPDYNSQSVIIKAGDGDDTFDFNQHKVAANMSIYGGDGNDVLNFGGGNLTTNIANLPTFLFDGQDGFDQFNLNNAAETSQWQYIRDLGTLRLDRTAPTPGYTIILNDANVEEMNVNAGPAADSFYVRAVAPDTSVTLNAGDGLDGLVLADSTQNLNGIQGLVRYYAGAAGGNILVSDNADTSINTVHLTYTTLGAGAGDNLFGPGGSLQFSDLVNFGAFPGITLNLGSGADTVFAEPMAVARVTVNGGNPTSAPGDVLWLSLVGVTSPVFAPNGVGAGTYTFRNAAAFNYTGFESAMGYIPGDYDGDGGVGTGDYDVWKANFGQTVTPGTLGDGNGDGIVNAADYTVWRNNLGATLPMSGSGGASVVALQVDTVLQPSSGTLAVAAAHYDVAVPVGTSAVTSDSSAGASPSRARLASVVRDSARDDALVAWLSASRDRGRHRWHANLERFADSAGGATGTHADGRTDDAACDGGLLEHLDAAFELVGGGV